MSKLDDLKSKFADMLSKTPFGKKGDDDFDEDYDGETSEFSSSDLEELQDDDVTEATSISLEEDEEDREIKKKLNKQMYIRIALVLVIVGLAADHFLNSGDGGGDAGDAALANLPDKKSKRKRKRKKPKKETSEETKVTGNKAGVNSDDLAEGLKNLKSGKLSSVPSDSPDGNNNDEVLKLDPEENNNKNVEVTKVETPPVEKKKEDASGSPPETPSDVLDMDSLENELSKLEEESKNENLPTKKVETTPTEETAPSEEATLANEPTPSLPKMGQNQNTEEMKKVEEEIKNNSKSLEDKMLESIKEAKKKEYVGPPNYENLGRGLVYNCTDKHWSCVDKKSFFQCRDNHAWIRANKKTPECAIKNVYANVKDCQKVQQYYVDNLITMDECSN
jgi:hypothetical protein